MPVYCISAGAGGPVKVGVAKDIWRRLEMLQTGNHEKLTIIGITDGGQEREAEILRQFAHLRIRGEWLRADGALLALFASPGPRPRRGAASEHPIAKYIDSQELTLSEFAKRVGMSAASISRIIDNKQNPSLGAIHRIAAASRGKIGANEIVRFCVPAGVA